MHRNARHDETMKRKIAEVTFSQKKGNDKTIIKRATEYKPERESVNLDGEVRPSMNVEVNLLFRGSGDSRVIEKIVDRT